MEVGRASNATRRRGKGETSWTHRILALVTASLLIGSWTFLHGRKVRVKDGTSNVFPSYDVQALHEGPKMQASDEEVELFTKWVSSTSKKGSTYFEFGSGGSTHLVLKTTNHFVVSIESTSAWSDKVVEQARSIGEEIRLQSIVVDIGPTASAGSPSNRSHIVKWPTYSSMISAVPSADVVFVDGRFRVACTLKTLLHATSRPIIIMHDFWNREKYHVVLEFVDVLENATTMAVLRSKEGFDRNRVATLAKKYELEPS